MKERMTAEEEAKLALQEQYKAQVDRLKEELEELRQRLHQAEATRKVEVEAK